MSAFYLPAVSTLCLLGGTLTAPGQAAPIPLTAYVGTYFESTITTSNPPVGLPPCNFSICTIQAIPGLPTGLDPTFDAAGAVNIAGIATTAAPATIINVYIGRAGVKYSSFPVNITIAPSEVKVASNGATATLDTRGYNGGHYYKAQVEILDQNDHPCTSYTPALDAPSGLSLDKDGDLISNAIVTPPPPAVVSITVHCSAPPGVYATFTILGPAGPPPAIAATDVSDLSIIAALSAKPPTPPSSYDSVCNYEFNDCDWLYSMVGGGEQSDLSSQTSQTDGFIDFIVRAPENSRFGYAWTRVRLLGAPTNSNIQGIVTNVTSPTSTTTMTSLSTVGYALDYVAGFEHDFFLATKKDSRDHSGRFTVGAIAYFGATTPLSSENATQGYAVPAYGTNECAQLQARFGAAGPNHQAGVPLYLPPLPAPGMIITTVTPTSGNPTTTVANYCSLMNPSTSVTTTTTSSGTTTVTGGTPITNIAFSPQDRSSFLLKYAVGARLINRWHANGTNHCSLRARDDHTEGDFSNGPCTRSIVDLTIGQDQAITGGTWSHFVFKSDVIFPIPKSPIYFFGSAAIRLQKNENLPPLILTPTPISSGASDTTTGAITIPSPSVFVLPLKQSDRDFYRIGLAVDLSSILTKLFTAQ